MSDNTYQTNFWEFMRCAVEGRRIACIPRRVEFECNLLHFQGTDHLVVLVVQMNRIECLI